METWEQGSWLVLLDFALLMEVEAPLAFSSSAASALP